MFWRKLKLRIRATELRIYAAFGAWHHYNCAAGVDFLHVCPGCRRTFCPIEQAACPRCRILKNRGKEGRERRLLYRFLEWRMGR